MSAAAADSVPRGTSPETPLADLDPVRWTTNDGLPTNTLLDVMQTRRGYIWVSGFGGLARFDGVSFEVFNQQSTPELEASSFYQVAEHQGTLWIASQGTGIWRSDDGRFAPLHEDQPRASIRSLLFDRAGTLWAGLAETGAARVRGGRLAPVGQAGLDDTTVRDILEGADGEMWFATEGEGLVRLSGGGTEAFTTASGLPDDSVTSLAPSIAGGFWVGTMNGAGRFHEGGITTLEALAGVEVFDLAEDDYGGLWIAAEQGLFRLAASGRLERLAELRGHSLRSVNGLAFDHEGSVWISSYTSGLYQLRESSLVSRGRADGLASDRVNSVYERRDGTVLVGGDLGAIQVLDDGVLSDLELRQPLPEVRVRGFLEDSRGDLWISSYAGLLRISGDRQKLFTEAEGLPTRRVRFVHEDSRGRIWAGTRGGGLVAITEGPEFESLDTGDGLASDFVLALAEDRSGNLLIGTQAGLSVLSGDGSIVNYGTRDGLPAELIFNIRIDGNGAAWIATTKGLARFLDGRIDAVGVRQGLPAEAIYDYAEDDRGGVWLTSSEGVARIDKLLLEEAMAGRRAVLEPRLFDQADGMIDQQCTGGARIEKTRDGALWIPTLGGLSRVQPDNIPVNPMPPPVYIDRFRVDGQTVRRLSDPDTAIEIGPGRKNFEFRFSALSYRAPSKAEVRYRLEGFDDDWLRAGTRRTALYTGLPPGELVFRVVAANRDGVWNREGASLRLRVRPHYYQTVWFLLLVALALTAVPWSVYRWRLRIVQRRSAVLERMLSQQRKLEAERTRLIGELESRNEQLENLTHAVSHDLKSPLFTIQGFAGALEKDLAANDGRRVTRDLRRIREAAGYMGRLLEQLSNVRRIERTGARLEEIDFGELAREVLAAVDGLIRGRGIRVTVDPSLPAVTGDRLQLTEMLQNLVDNAARFMGDQPEPRIDIGWREEGAETVFFVRDNGMGIAHAHQRRIFALFERLDHGLDGTGIGLTIVKRVVEAHRGRVWVESEGEGRGSTLCFTLPAGRQAPRSPEGR